MTANRLLASALVLLAGLAMGCAKSFAPCVASDGSWGLFSEPDTRTQNATHYFKDEYAYVCRRLTKLGAEAAGNCTSVGDAQPDAVPLRPRVLVGLALSGGGLRSNAFQLGLLNGLGTAETGPTAMDNVSYLSSVSGGSWAAAAYVTDRSGSTPSRGLFQAINSGVLLDRSLLAGQQAGGGPAAAEGESNCVRRLVSRVLNNDYSKAVLTSLRSTSSLVTGYTMNEAWREMVLRNHLNGKDWWLRDLADEQSAKPFWIINTASNAKAAWEAQLNFPFEFTPYTYGAIADCGSTNYCASSLAYYGFWRTTRENPDDDVPPVRLSHALAMSSAVLPPRGGGSLTEMEWYFPVPRLTRVKLASCPRDLDKRPNPARHGKPVTPSIPMDMVLDTELQRDKYMLSDGGHAENYGALALMERDVDLLIISDAAHDPAYTFGDYGVLKNHTRNLLGKQIYLGGEINKGHDWAKRLREGMPLQEELPEQIERAISTGVPGYYGTLSFLNAMLYQGVYGKLADTPLPQVKDQRAVIYVRPPKSAVHEPFMEYLKAKHRKTGLADSGYLETYRFLKLNEAALDFPNDKTFVVAYSKDLMYAYYLLGTYIGESRLAPELRAFIKAKLEANIHN